MKWLLQDFNQPPDSVLMSFDDIEKAKATAELIVGNKECLHDGPESNYLYSNSEGEIKVIIWTIVEEK